MTHFDPGFLLSLVAHSCKRVSIAALLTPFTIGPKCSRKSSKRAGFDRVEPWIKFSSSGRWVSGKLNFVVRDVDVVGASVFVGADGVDSEGPWATVFSSTGGVTDTVVEVKVKGLSPT